MPQKSELIHLLEDSIKAQTFVKMTLSKSIAEGDDLKKVLIKPIALKAQPYFNFVYRYTTKDITKNYPTTQGMEFVELLVGNSFMNANLFTTENDIQLELKKPNQGKGRIRFMKPSQRKPASLSHDKQKQHWIVAENNVYLRALDVVTSKGRIAKDKGGKFKQINKYIEILDGLMKASGLNQQKRISVVDMGSGKGYLTFAIYDYLANQLKVDTAITGLEMRPNLVATCNSIAQKAQFSGLQFQQGLIQDYDMPQTDILMALHACDTATDDALYKGITANVPLIICAPCCHKQIRQQMKGTNTWKGILKHGILAERQAEIATDAIRALLLEAHGYKTKVFEFISTEHTGKNVMIVGIKQKGKIPKQDYLQQIEHIKQSLGISEHYLEQLWGQ